VVNQHQAVIDENLKAANDEIEAFRRALEVFDTYEYVVEKACSSPEAGGRRHGPS